MRSHGRIVSEGVRCSEHPGLSVGSALGGVAITLLDPWGHTAASPVFPPAGLQALG